MPVSLVEAAAATLQEIWASVLSAAEDGPPSDAIEEDDGELLESIRLSVNSNTKTYRYVLPTQLLAKIADPALDCRSLQAGADRTGSFDARTIAHQVIVPFDQANDRVLGGSPEPYVNNPVRVSEVSERHRNPQKTKGAGTTCVACWKPLKAPKMRTSQRPYCVRSPLRYTADCQRSEWPTQRHDGLVCLGV